MKLRPVVFTVLVLAAVGAPFRPAGALTIGQIDTFASGTTTGWSSGAGGNPVPPIVIPSGGPAGAGDSYLLVRAQGGFGAGSRLAAINASQWAGDYTAAGVAGIRMNLLNVGATALAVRLMIAHRSLTAADMVITAPFLLPVGSGWTTAIFSLAPAQLTTLMGDANAALAQATEVRIFHNEDPVYPPPAIVGSLGADNIEAVDASVPTQRNSWGQIKRLYR